MGSGRPTMQEWPLRSLSKSTETDAREHPQSREICDFLALRVPFLDKVGQYIDGPDFGVASGESR